MTIIKPHVALLWLLPCALPACATTPVAGSPPDTESFARGWIDAWDDHDVDRILTYYTEDAFYEDVPNVENGWAEPMRGHRMIRASLIETFDEMTDVGFEFVSASRAGDRMVVEWLMTGTHDQDFTGEFSIRGVSLITLEGGRIASVSDYYDAHLLLDRLGMVRLVGDAQARTDGESANEELVRAFTAAANETDWARVAELITEDFTRHSSATAGPPVTSRDAFIALQKSFLESFPDQHVHLEHLIADGDFVAVRALYTGTHEGPLGEFPATGKSVSGPFLAIFRIEDGRIAELWVEWDNLVMLTQLGLFPPP